MRGLGRAPRLLWLAAFLAACAAPTAAPSATPTASQAIERFQSLAGLPASPCVLVETTAMLNSPDGSLAVDIYQDQQGRKYSLDPATNQVVEIDARNQLESIAPDSELLGLSKLREEALDLAQANTPNWASLNLTYSESQKGDLYFFDWRTPGSANGPMNPPFTQVALHAGGELIAYYNTLNLKSGGPP